MSQLFSLTCQFLEPVFLLVFKEFVGTIKGKNIIKLLSEYTGERGNGM